MSVSSIMRLSRLACPLALLVIFLASAGRLAAADTALLSDQFSDQNRFNQSLPGSARWYYAGAAGAVTRLATTPPPSSSQLRIVSGGGQGSTAMALAYFTDAGSPRSLSAGESLTLEFTLRLDRLWDSPENLRFALFNSLNSRPAADDSNYTYGSVYAATHNGYQVAFNAGAAAGPMRIYERNNQGVDSPFYLNTGAVRGTNAAAALNLPVKQAFPVKLVIARSSGSGNSLTLTATVNGVTVSGTDSGSLITSFDGLGVSYTDEALGPEQELRIDDVTVRHASAAATPVVTTLLNESFTDNERLTQTLPDSARWFYNGYGPTADRCTTATPVARPRLELTPGGSDAMALAFFTASGSPRNLAIGDSISLQANVHLDLLPNAADGIRFGLFNSQAVRPANDIEGGIASTATFTGYRGYDVGLNPADGGDFNLYRRHLGGAGLFDPATRERLGDANPASLALSNAPETTPRFNFTITRVSASTLRIESAINGRGVVRVDTAATTTAFDTFAFFVGANAYPYDGPQAILDFVSVTHASAPVAVPSLGKILSQTFDGSTWSAASFAGSQSTGAITTDAFGTIDVRGAIVPTGGLRLAVDSSAASGPWSGELRSGLLPITNTETNLGKLTLAFDLRASSARPVRVRIESADAGGVVGGTMERVISPAAPNTFQRYALELSDFTLVAGTFDPTAPNLRLSYALLGGSGDFDSWPVGAHTVDLDNVYYASPAYYVKPAASGGNNNANGRTEATAFATVARALQVAGAGDIVLLMEGTSAPAYPLSSGLGFSRGGSSAGWVTLKNYPGQRPTVFMPVLAGDTYYSLAIAGGYPGNFDYSTSLNYIEIRGFRLQGAADQLPEADRGGSTGRSNVSGVSIDGRYMALLPHHLRVADMEVFNFPGGGIGGAGCDWAYFENNSTHDTSNWTIYASSGMSILEPSNFDGTAGTHRMFWLGNCSYRNETKIPWEAINAISDGNGIIVDTFLTTSVGPYLGRSLVANNVCYENGGSGIHALRVSGLDIVHNTVYRNSHSPALNYASIFGYESNDINVANNIIVASPGEPINGGGYTPAFPRTSGIRYLNNLYFSEGTSTPYTEANDAGNRTATSAGQVGFVDGPSGDFRLGTGSLAIDGALTGLATPALRDFYNLPRGSDGLPDIGAIEPLVLPTLAGPTPQAVDLGATANFSVSAVNPAAGSSFTYQWQRNGSELLNKTASTLTLTNVGIPDIASYNVLATYSIQGKRVGVMPSSPANLTINGIVALTNRFTLSNPSFEESLGYTGGNPGTIPGWPAINGGTYGTVQANTSNSLFTSGVTGSRVIYPGGGFAQTVAATFVEGATYTLTVNAGQPVGVSAATGFIFGFRSGNQAVNGGFLPVGAGSSFVGTFPASGTMQTYVVSYTATAADVGKPIIIGFFDYFAGDERFRLDNVTLSSTVILTGLAAWRETNFPGSTATTGEGANANDFERDGIANLMEYATGTDPKVGNGSPVIPLVSNGFLNLTFNHIADPALTYTIKASDDLSAFPATATSYTGFTTAGSTTYQDAVSLSSAARRFLRLEVSVP